MAVALALSLIAIPRARQFLGRLVGRMRHDTKKKSLPTLRVTPLLFLRETPFANRPLPLSATEVLGILNTLLRILIPSLPFMTRSMAGVIMCALCLDPTDATDRPTVLLPEVLTLSVPSIVIRILLLTLRQLRSTLMQSAVIFISPVR